MRGTLAARLFAKVEKTAGCWVFEGAMSHGYGRIGRGSRDAGTVTAHRASWEIHNGPVPPGLFVLHRCDNRPCVRPAHLFLGNQAANVADCREKGRGRNPPVTSMPGERNPRAVLTEMDVATIRERYALGGVTQRALADEFGVHNSAVNMIVKRRRWAP